jgi:hypothetical protein
VTATVAQLQQQLAVALRIVDAWRKDSTAAAEVRAMREQVATLKQGAAGPAAGAAAGAPSARADSLTAFDQKLAALLSGGAAGGRGAPGAAGGAGRAGAAASPDNLARVNAALGGLYGIVEGYDGAPTTQAARAVGVAERTLADLLARWDALKREGASLGVPGR